MKSICTFLATALCGLVLWLVSGLSVRAQSTILFTQNFDGTASLTSTTPNNTQFDAFYWRTTFGSVISSSGSLGAVNGKLHFVAHSGIGYCGPPTYSGCRSVDGGGAAYADRTTPLAASSVGLLHIKFDLAVRIPYSSPQSIFSLSFGNEPGYQGQSYQFTNGSSSQPLPGTNYILTKFNGVDYDMGSGLPVAFFANNTAGTQTYMAPNGTIVSLAANNVDVWINTAKVQTNALLISPNALKFTIGISTYGGQYDMEADVDNLLIEALSVAAPCVTNSTLKSGSWNDPTVWSCGTVPLAIDNVVISPGHTVVMDSPTQQAHNVRLNGRLSFPNTGKLIIN